VDLVVDAACIVSELQEGTELWKVGPSLEDRQLTRLHRAGVLVRELADLDVQELATTYRDATVLVFPSADEGFGLPVVEALAVGLPVVLSDIPVLREVAGKFGHYISGSDAADYARAVVEICETSPSVDVADGSRSWAAQFTWDKHIALLEEIYSELLPSDIVKNAESAT
jgi:glycosyltransferase involved in cell wall biosynthesis